MYSFFEKWKWIKHYFSLYNTCSYSHTCDRRTGLVCSCLKSLDTWYPIPLKCLEWFVEESEPLKCDIICVRSKFCSRCRFFVSLLFSCLPVIEKFFVTFLCFSIIRGVYFFFNSILVYLSRWDLNPCVSRSLLYEHFSEMYRSGSVLFFII